MEQTPKATEAAQPRHIAFDDLFDQLVLTARRIVADQQIAVHGRDTEQYDAITRELQAIGPPGKSDS